MIRRLTVALIACAAAAPVARASNHLVQIHEVMAGANGDSRVQFVRLRLCCPGENRWGPQAGEAAGRARLIFRDANGADIGTFVFPADPPDHLSGGIPDADNAISVLVATQAFANLPGMPAPDFLMPSNLLVAGGGQVCFAHNPAIPAAQPVNLCLSYGNFAADTGQDLHNPPNPAGPPAAALPITGAQSLRRAANPSAFGTHQFNADFQLSTAAPRNAAGQTGTIGVLTPQQQGETLFFQETFLGNGRTCGSCHLPRDRFGLSPTTIGLLPDNDPLFVPEFNPVLEALENMCLVRSTRGLIEEHIDGFDQPFVYRGSPHLLNIAHTAPYGLSGEFADLRVFSAGAVRQHFPRTLARNGNPQAGPIDFREPSDDELAALEAFMNGIEFPADGDFNLDRMINAAIARGGNAEAINRGRTLFISPGNCFRCHSGPVLADVDQSMIDQGLVIVPPGGSRNLKFNTGVVRLPINNSPEVNSCLDTALPSEAGGNREFSTPPLIGAARTGPFFHDHSALTLREAVAFYNSTQFNQSPAGQLIGGISLSESDIDDITAFLDALDDPDLVIGQASGLAIGPIAPQSLGIPFNVTVTAIDDNNRPASVTQDTAIALTLRTGIGTLGGTLTATILAGTHTVTLENITYDTIEKGVGLRVTRTSGQMLAAANSNQFNFCHTVPTLQLTSPNGGGVIQAGGLHIVTWDSTDAFGLVNLTLLKNGQVHSTLGTAPATAGSFDWDVCRYVGDGGDYRLRITTCHCAGCTVDESDADFAIVNSAPQPALTVTSPNGGENWPAGSLQNVTWTSADSTGFVSIDLLKNGQPYRGVGFVEMAAGSFAWNICEFVGDGSDYRVRVSQCDCPDCVEDASDSFFSISGSTPQLPLALSVTSPNGGEVFNVGTSQMITWAAANPVGDVAIELLVDGQFHQSIGSTPMGAGQFEWNICAQVAAGSNYTIRLTHCDCSGCVQDVGDAPFSVIGSGGQPLLTLIAPNGGEAWPAGTVQEITWSAPLAAASDTVELFLFQGNSFSPIGSAPARGGRFTWSVCPFIGNSAEASVFARYFDVSCGELVVDGSDSLFSIIGSIPVPTLMLTGPNGGQALQAGSSQVITWSSSNPAGVVQVYLMHDASKMPLGAAPMSNGQLEWVICPFLIAQSDYRIRLEVDCGLASLADESDGGFAITQPAVPGSGAGDLDADCDIDADDTLISRQCGFRATVAHDGTPACQAADLDGDGDVDLNDFGQLQRLYRP